MGSKAHLQPRSNKSQSIKQLSNMEDAENVPWGRFCGNRQRPTNLQPWGVIADTSPIVCRVVFASDRSLDGCLVDVFLSAICQIALCPHWFAGALGVPASAGGRTVSNGCEKKNQFYQCDCRGGISISALFSFLKPNRWNYHEIDTSTPESSCVPRGTTSEERYGLVIRSRLIQFRAVFTIRTLW